MRWYKRLYHRIRNHFLLKRMQKRRIPCPAIKLPGLENTQLRAINQLIPVNYLGMERGTGVKTPWPWKVWWNQGVIELYRWSKWFSKFFLNPRYKQSVIVMQEGMNGHVAPGQNIFTLTDLKQAIQFTGTYDWSRPGLPRDKPGSPQTEPFPKSVVMWRTKNYFQNHKLIDCGEPVTNINANGPCYIVGNGPSLEKQAHLLKNITKGTRVALNGAYKKCFPYVDYFWCGDWLGMKHWLEGIDVHGHRAIFVIHAPGFLTGREWKMCYWYAHNTTEHHTRAMLTDLKKRYGIRNMPLYDQGVTVTYTAYHWAVLQGFNPIIFVGVDGLLTNGGQLHTDDTETVQQKNAAEDTKVGHAVEHVGYCSFLDAATIFVNRMGVRVINAAPVGESILGHNPIYRDKHRMEHIPLEKVIDEMEAT